MSLELEVLDQLQGGDLPLPTIRTLFADEESFNRAISGLVRSGDVRLLTDGFVVPAWRLRELFADSDSHLHRPPLTVQLTDQGGRRIA